MLDMHGYLFTYPLDMQDIWSPTRGVFHSGLQAVGSVVHAYCWVYKISGHLPVGYFTPGCRPWGL